MGRVFAVQLLTVIWVSLLWAILACGMMFHAEYIMRIAHYYVVHEEREALLCAAMRAACIQYRLDNELQKRLVAHKRYAFQAKLVRRNVNIDIAYEAQTQGDILIRVRLVRDESALGSAEHLFSARSLSLTRDF